MNPAGGDPALENLSSKEAAADALAALDVVLDVAQVELNTY